MDWDFLRCPAIIISVCIVSLISMMLIPISSTPLTADFTAVPDSGTVPLTVQLNDTSTGSPTAWDWSYPSPNMLLYSQDLNRSDYWQLHKARLEPADIPAPDGTMTAFKMIDDNIYAAWGLNDHFIAYGNPPIIPLQENTSYTASVHLRPAGIGWADIVIFGGYDTAWRSGFFDITNGTKGATGIYPEGAGNSLILNIVPEGNGWYRCIVTFTTKSGVVLPTLEIFSSKGDLTDTPSIDYTGNNMTGIYIWGAQLEKGSAATPYVRTTAENIVHFSTSQNPVITFPTPGNYSVTLNATNANDHSSRVHWVNVSESP